VGHAGRGKSTIVPKGRAGAGLGLAVGPRGGDISRAGLDGGRDGSLDPGVATRATVKTFDSRGPVRSEGRRMRKRKGSFFSVERISPRSLALLRDNSTWCFS